MTTPTQAEDSPVIPDHKFPFEPLEALARASYIETPDRPWSDRAFGEMIGFPGVTISRWRRKGCLPWDSADVAAVRIGKLPIEVWGHRWIESVRTISDHDLAEAWAAIDEAIEARVVGDVRVSQ